MAVLTRATTRSLIKRPGQLLVTFIYPLGVLLPQPATCSAPPLQNLGEIVYSPGESARFARGCLHRKKEVIAEP
jgi:hypothetical protein